MSEIDRRNFLKLVGVSAGATAAAGCSELPEKLIPYVIQPEEIVPGVAVFYASTCQECSVGCGLHVRTREGRPVKLEGNPDHPINRGTLCARGQASIDRTYHPGRYESPMQRGSDGTLTPITWEEATKMLAEKLSSAGSKAQLLGTPTGPTLANLIDEFASAVSAGGNVQWEPFAQESLREATRMVFGVAQEPIFQLSNSDYIIDFGSDFLEQGPTPRYAREFVESRDILAHPDGGARLVSVGPRLSQTIGNADEWLPANPGSEGILALGIANAALSGSGGSSGEFGALLADFGAEVVATKTGVSAEVIRRIGKSAAAAGSPVALPPGSGLTSRRATATNAAVLILNQVLGAVGKNVQIAPPADAAGEASGFRDVVKQIAAMKAGDVSVLLVYGGNPVYSLPADAGFSDAIDKVGFVVSFASTPNETSEKADLILPDNTPLESWGDSAPVAGVRSIVQPTLRPLYDTQSLGDTLLQTARAMGDNVAARLPEGSFRSILESAWAGVDWRKALALGGDFANAPVTSVQLSSEVSKLEVVEPELEGSGEYTLFAHPSPLLGDGSGADLPWLQETPDPVSSLCWQSWAEISRNTAEKLGVDIGDALTVTTPYGALEVPAFPRGGIRDDVIAIATGQGHTVGHFASLENDGRPGEARGVNVLSVLPALTDESGGLAYLSTKADVTSAGRHQRLPLTQYTDNKRGRQLGDAIPLSELVKAGGGAEAHSEGGEEQAAEHGGGHGEAHEILRPYDATDDSTAESLYRWGMTIDLDRCDGCAACVVACSVENNVPVVGEAGLLRRRQMTWLRIERYVGDGWQELRTGRPSRQDHEELGKVDVRHSPMMCQQCGAAPCEPVCPVIATYHADDGLNAMTYNRCIGTRYCSNNCPYKVRRYNWFDYSIENLPDPMRLRLNPDVTVRGQGVMEKCTYCVQRIAGARQLAKDEGRPIADGEARTACQQTCPTNAISFGNLKDEKAEVVQKAENNDARSYHALHVLNTRPATTYLKKVIRDGEGA
jgi:anaerobic selenocysteine-containing dehydrogenase/Fe-S-cluster-containing dehydrogenase component